MVALAAALVCFVPAICRAQAVGDHASTAPRGWPVPPGHYGLLASYADGFLLAGPFTITWSALNDLTDAPGVPDELDDFFVLDVRTEAQYNARHIPGAVNIPFAVVVPWLAELPADQPILVVCGSGLMSGEVGAILGMLGYEIRVLVGGMTSVPVTP